MQGLKRLSILLLLSLVSLSALACRGLSTEIPSLSDVIPQPTVDSQAIVREVVATLAAQDAAAQNAAATPAASSAAAALAATNGDLQGALIQLYEKANPAVVHIFILGEDDIVEGTGSGFVYDADGHIVTNNHVVTGVEKFEVVFQNGERQNATVVGSDVDSDLAVIKVDSIPDGVTPLPVGESSAIQVGQFVVAIGNPFGEAGSMTVGIVSGLGRTLASQRIAEGGGRYSLPSVIQTDAAINPGNSGGPLLSLDGQVLGVNSAIRTDTGANSGVGFSIPANAVKRIVPALIADGRYAYPYMGIRMTALDLATQTRLKLPQVQGAYVTDVTAGSAAEAAGVVSAGTGQTGEPLAGGDLIVAADGTPINSPDDMISYLVFETEVGQTINLTVLRDGTEVTVPLTLGERP